MTSEVTAVGMDTDSHSADHVGTARIPLRAWTRSDVLSVPSLVHARKAKLGKLQQDDRRSETEKAPFPGLFE